MDRSVDFGASFAIRESPIQTLGRVHCKAGRLNPRINVAARTVTANLFLSLQTVSYCPGSGKPLVIDLFAWGPISVTPPNDVQVEPDGTQRILGLQVGGRRSAIHRTVLAGPLSDVATLLAAEAAPARLARIPARIP